MVFEENKNSINNPTHYILTLLKEKLFSIERILKRPTYTS